MDEVWKSIKRHNKLYIILGCLLTTMILVNETLDFYERLKGNIMLRIFSLVVFYFLVQIVIEELVRK